MDIKGTYASQTMLSSAEYTRNVTAIRGITFRNNCKVPSKIDGISLEDSNHPIYAEMKIIEKGCSKSLTYSSRTIEDNSERADGILNELNGISGSESLSCGALCYSYMERTVLIERKIGGSEITMLSKYKEERLYYSELLSGSYSVPDSANRDGFKYNFDNGFSGNEVTEALADVQSRIDKLVSYKNRMTDDKYSKALNAGYERFGKCAGFLADFFGENVSELIPDKEGYEKLFGEVDADEKTFACKAEEKRDALSEFLNKLTNLREKWLKNQESDTKRKYSDMLSVLDRCAYSELTAMLFFGKTSMLNILDSRNEAVL